MKQVLAISGTPGTGKTAAGMLLAKRLNVEVLELSQLVEREKLYSRRDEARDTLVADMEALEEYLAARLPHARRTPLVLGHFADIVPDELLKYLVVLRCHPIVLADRLKERQWTHAKILENIQAEILGECTSQAMHRHPVEKIFEIDVSQLTKEEVVNRIEKIFSGQSAEYTPSRISWLQVLDAQVLHRIMEKSQLP
ncbi:MAG: adenylate kinase family protein [Promethearchaeota archaeon]